MKNEKSTKHISEVKKGDCIIVNGCEIIASSDAYLTKTDTGREWNFESGNDYYYASDFENGIVDILIKETDDGCKIPVPYVSVWDGGIEIETTAVVDIRTGEVTDITAVDVNGLEICERQYIIMSSEQVDVYTDVKLDGDDHEYDYWADCDKIFECEEEDNNMNDLTTKCVNGTLQANDLVISTPDDDYACLVGRAMKINLLGTPEHDEETENETDDVHVNFLEFEYPKKRLKEIEDDFCGLYSQKKDLDDCGLDDVIMAPCCLIRITDIDEPSLNHILQSGYNAACYCYGILSGLTDQIELDGTQMTISPVTNEMEILNHADSGFKITRMICGKKVDIELTSQELSNAFYFQERKYHIADIGISLEEMENNDELQGYIVKKILADENLMNKILSEYEDKIDDGMQWNDAVIFAIKENIKNTENQEVSE